MSKQYDQSDNIDNELTKKLTKLNKDLIELKILVDNSTKLRKLILSKSKLSQEDKNNLNIIKKQNGNTLALQTKIGKERKELLELLKLQENKEDIKDEKKLDILDKLEQFKDKEKHLILLQSKIRTILLQSDETYSDIEKYVKGDQLTKDEIIKQIDAVIFKRRDKDYDQKKFLDDIFKPSQFLSKHYSKLIHKYLLDSDIIGKDFYSSFSYALSQNKDKFSLQDIEFILNEIIVRSDLIHR